MSGMKYRGWTNTAGKMVILNARHIVRVTVIDDENVRVHLVDGNNEAIRSTMKNFESWLSS